MSARVPHRRPDLDATVIKSQRPVSADDWARLAGLANFVHGHGAMLIPWSAIGRVVPSGNTELFHFYVGPKSPAVQRVWRVNLRSSSATGTTADVKVGGVASAVTVYPLSSRDPRAGAHLFYENLSAKTNTAADTTLSVHAIGGDVRVESVSMYEQTRGNLDLNSTDYGVALETVRPRQQIFDRANENVRGVADAYKNADARRAGYFHWATPTGVAIPVTATSGSPLSLFPLACPVQGAIPTRGDTTTTLTIAAYAKVDAGTGIVKAASSQAAANGQITVSGTSFAWFTTTVTIDTEDMTVADGRRGSAWEDLTWTAWRVAPATTLSVASVSAIRVTTPL